MKNCLSKFCIIVLLFLCSINVFAEESTTDYFNYLRKKTIFEIQKDKKFGTLIDVRYPSNLISCFIFIFKHDNLIYEITANSENLNYYKDIKAMNLNEYIATGFYQLRDINGNVLQEMFPKSTEKKYLFLNKYKMNDYIPIETVISEIKNKIGIEFVRTEKGGFLEPFYVYIFFDGEGYLQLIASPNNEKKESYFLCGWDFKIE